MNQNMVVDTETIILDRISFLDKLVILDNREIDYISHVLCDWTLTDIAQYYNLSARAVKLTFEMILTKLKINYAGGSHDCNGNSNSNGKTNGH